MVDKSIVPNWASGDGGQEKRAKQTQPPLGATLRGARQSSILDCVHSLPARCRGGAYHIWEGEVGAVPGKILVKCECGVLGEIFGPQAQKNWMALQQAQRALAAESKAAQENSTPLL